MAVPVRLGEAVSSRFLLDTGIGVTVVSKGLAGQVATVPTSEVATGRRMSGQEIASPIDLLPSLQLGGQVWHDLKVATLDLGGLHPMLSSFGGILSLGPFERLPFTLDSQRLELRLHSDGTLPAPPEPAYEEAPLEVRRNGPDVSAFVDLEIPSGATARVEVDSGSESLILHDRFMTALGVLPGGASVRSAEGEDETGFRFVRHFARVEGEVRLKGTTSVRQRNPSVMFQRIIYDGLLGDDFLRRFNVTFDLARARIGFAVHRS
jgi:hypothetical protein